MSEILHQFKLIWTSINWEWMAPIVGCFVAAAFIVFTLWVTAKAITAMEDAANSRRAEFEKKLQRQDGAIKWAGQYPGGLFGDPFHGLPMPPDLTEMYLRAELQKYEHEKTKEEPPEERPVIYRVGVDVADDYEKAGERE